MSCGFLEKVMKASPKGGSVISARRRERPMEVSRGVVLSEKMTPPMEPLVSQTAMQLEILPLSLMRLTRVFHWAVSTLSWMAATFAPSSCFALGLQGMFSRA